MVRRISKLAAMAVLAGAFGLAGMASLRADPAPAAKPDADALAAMASSLKWQTGTITLKDGLATINLTDDFRFLGNADARKVLHDIWGNPDDPDILGMIFPKDRGPLDDNTWAVTVNYEDGGYMKDDDADKIDYTDMLKKMQQEASDTNPEREKEGYPSIELVGWAAQPHYDKATHKLYWAKELHFGDSPEHTLNYDIRILGRHGWLVLSAIAVMNQLPEIDGKVPGILSMVDFQPGNTYADFDPKVDKIAEYGLATLIAGGALAGAAKLGLLGGLWKFIVVGGAAAWKFILAGAVAVGAAVKKFWGKVTGKDGRDS